MPNNIPLTEYFRSLDRYLETTGLMPTVPLRVRICDRLLEFRFPSTEQADYCRLSLDAFVTEETGEPDALFLHWFDDCRKYLPCKDIHPNGIVQSQDSTGTLRILMGDGILMGSDTVRRRFYSLQSSADDRAYIRSRHANVQDFFRWAACSGLFMVHGAAVGVNGTGVLVVGRGGRGKSTFAVSCLAQGLDFISDDYSLITVSGPILAKPLYSIVGLMPDMCGNFKEFGEPMRGPDGSLMGIKPQYSIPAHRFAKQLEIKAIILPTIGGTDEVSLTPVSPGPAMTQLIHSTVIQSGSHKDTRLIMAMSQRFMGLPVYEMRMSTDLKKNPAFLRLFIEKEYLSCTD